MAELKHSYVTWNDGKISVVVQKPMDGECEGYFDPAHFDTSDPRSLFLLWYTTLTVGLWHVPPMDRPAQVYNELIHNIDEFEEIDDLDFFTADHDVSWRELHMGSNENIPLLEAVRERALRKGRVYPGAINSEDAVRERLVTAQRFTEEWRAELQVIFGEWDSSMRRAAVAQFAEILVQWVNDTEPANSRYREWVVDYVTSRTGLHACGGSDHFRCNKELKAYVTEELRNT